MSYEIKGLVQQQINSYGEGSEAPLRLNRRGEIVLIDFYTQMAMEKRGFELRGGYDQAEETGDQALASTAAEACVDAHAGLTLIPCYFGGMLTTAAGTVNEVELRGIGANATAGTAVAPNPLWKGSSIASTAIGQLNDEGGVTVSADAVTTTNNLFSWGGEIAMGDYNIAWDWRPLMPSLGVGPYCAYVAIGGTGTGPEYCFTMHWIELPSTVVD